MKLTPPERQQLLKIKREDYHVTSDADRDALLKAIAIWIDQMSDDTLHRWHEDVDMCIHALEEAVNKLERLTGNSVTEFPQGRWAAAAPASGSPGVPPRPPKWPPE